MAFQATGSRTGYDGKSRPVFTYQDALAAYDSGASYNQVNDWLSQQQYRDNLRPIDGSGQTWDSMIKPTVEHHQAYNANAGGGAQLPDAYEVHGVRGYQDADAAHFLAGWATNENTAKTPQENRVAGGDYRDMYWNPSTQTYSYEIYRGSASPAGGSSSGPSGSTATSGTATTASTAIAGVATAGSGQKASSAGYEPNFQVDTNRFYSDSSVRGEQNAYERTTETGGDRSRSGGYSYRPEGGGAPDNSGEHRQDGKEEDDSFSSQWRKYTASGQPLAGSMFGAFS